MENLNDNSKIQNHAENKSETKNKSKLNLTKEEMVEIFHSIFVRVLFFCEAIILLIFVSCIINSQYYIFMVILVLVIIGDGIFVVVKRKGKEYKWFSISVAAFTIIFIISVWILVFYKFNLGDPGCRNSTLTSFSSGNFCFSLKSTICDFLYILVQMVLIFFTIGRWQMPIENLSRDVHIDLIMVLLIACADCADFFKYTVQNEIQNDIYVVSGILVLFSISLIQFSVTFTAVKEKRKDRDRMSKFRKLIDVCFCTKLWSILLVMITQDIPFFITRVILVFAYNVTSDRTIFLYIIKNGILIYFDIYRMFFIIRDYLREEKVVSVEYSKE